MTQYIQFSETIQLRQSKIEHDMIMLDLCPILGNLQLLNIQAVCAFNLHIPYLIEYKYDPIWRKKFDS